MCVFAISSPVTAEQKLLSALRQLRAGEAAFSSRFQKEGSKAKAMGMQQSRFRAKYVVLAFIAAMAAYVLYHNESFLSSTRRTRSGTTTSRSNGGYCRTASPVLQR